MPRVMLCWAGARGKVAHLILIELLRCMTHSYTRLTPPNHGTKWPCAGQAASSVHWNVVFSRIMHRATVGHGLPRILMSSKAKNHHPLSNWLVEQIRLTA